MLRYLIALMCCLSILVFSDEDELTDDLFLSTPEQIAALGCEPSYLIGGVVSPLSGQLVLRRTDLVVKGAQSITLSRTYIPPYMPCSFPKHKHNKEALQRKYLAEHLQENYQGWQFYPHLRCEIDLQTRTLRLRDPSGVTLDFSFPGPDFSIISPLYAISNVAGDIPSGQYDPRNTRASYDEATQTISVYVPDGTMRIYQHVGPKNYCTVVYRLQKEILPNGKILKYTYGNRGRLQSVQALDPQERHVYSSLHVEGSPWDNQCHFSTSSGLTADYNYQRRELSWKIKEKKKLEVSTYRSSQTTPPILTAVSSPFYAHETLNYCDRLLLCFYSGQESIFDVVHGCVKGTDNYFVVHKFQAPVGHNDAFDLVHQIFYGPPIAGEKEGDTAVDNSDGTTTRYFFSKNLLTTAIQYYGQDKSLKKEKLFAWDDNRLTSLEVRDGDKNLFYRKTYTYDSYGNPIVETFTGNLSGNGDEETFTTTRVFSDDGKHLLLQEETEDGKSICFTYLPGTNLPTSKLIKNGEKIIQRQFHAYDDCNNLIQTISDDGTSPDKGDLTGLTQRITKTYTLRQSAPFLHMPEWIQETYLENGTERLLTKSYLIYDQHGNIAEEEVYDAQDKYAYTIYKTYNERGDVLTETNPLGQKAVYTYTAKGQLETSHNFSRRLQTSYQHDRKGRLRKKVEQGDDGVVHTTTAEYDFHDRPIQKRDLLGNTTHYTYDPLVNAVAKTDFPAIASASGESLSVTTSATYDPFGRQLTQTDANGHITAYYRNAYGSPTKIIHANGSTESFIYAKNGDLVSHTDADGLTIHYIRDALGRVLSKTYLSPQEQTLAEETFTYSGFNLLTETDKEGNTTFYTYDGAGRKIREALCGHITEFTYDALGWLTTITKRNGTNTLLIHYTRDLGGQIIEERKTDAVGHLLYQIQYTYDADGNPSTTTRSINGHPSTEAYAYDSFKRETLYRDAKGQETATFYNEAFKNTLGQNVLQIRKTDPLQIVHVETQDALGRFVRKEVVNSSNNTLASEEWIRDPHGNVIYQKDHIYEGNDYKDTQTIHFTYTPDHQIATSTRAFGTPFSKTTCYTYFPSGRIATKTLPDGIILNYTYHPLGFLSRLDSSDDSIHYAFDYNLLGHLRHAIDEYHHTTLTRAIDPFGNILHETFSNGLEIQKHYDSFNRLITLTMGTQGTVNYTYDPLFLRTITRKSPHGHTLYTHHYKDYDLSGHLLTENLIGALGTITHKTDLNQRKLSISSAYFSQHCTYDPASNLINLNTNGIPNNYIYDQLYQLSSENHNTYLHDSVHNRVQRNGHPQQINQLNELISSENAECSYDDRGNQIFRQTPSKTWHFVYDPLNRLTQAISEDERIHFLYDPLDRRLSKTVFTKEGQSWKQLAHENYLYDGQQEIGAFSSPSTPTNLRVLNPSNATVAIELSGKVFAPILDVQGNIRRLVDPSTQNITDSSDFTAFGEELHTIFRNRQLNPWRFASKRFDPELGLVYFGKRYYDPYFGRWLTTDPAGFLDSVNLYQYLFGNPFKYTDPDGQCSQNGHGHVPGVTKVDSYESFEKIYKIILPQMTDKEISRSALGGKGRISAYRLSHS